MSILNNIFSPSMMVYPPKWIRMWMKSALWSVYTNEKKIFLTFDDGPTPEITPFVLSLLKQYNAKATFFCIGKNIVQHPEIFNTISENGHSIGNHSKNHLNGWKTNIQNYLSDVNECDNLLSEIRLFRPPYGRLSIAQYNALKKRYKVVMWDVLSMDYEQSLSSEIIFNNVIKYSKNGSIIVFHDSIKANKHLQVVLPKVLAYYSEKGYTFDAL